MKSLAGSAVDIRKKFGKDVLFLPPPDLGTARRSVAARGSGVLAATAPTRPGPLDYLKFAAQDKYVAAVAKATTTSRPPTRPRRRWRATRPGGENEIFLDYAKKYAVLRPVTPGYPFIATEFTKTAQDILNGADPQQSLDQAVKDIDANQKSNNYFE